MKHILTLLVNTMLLTSASGDGGLNHRDATIVKSDGNWVMVLNDETLTPPAKNLRSEGTGLYEP